MKKQKNTTKNGKKEKSRRSKAKYPALNKGMNLSSRKDYIEPDYVNGVYDSEGRQVIRALTEDEKSFLNKFYEETIVTNFYHDKELRTLNRHKKDIIEDATVKELFSQLKELEKDKENNKKKIKDLKEIIKLTKKQNEEIYNDELSSLEEELDELRKEKLLYPDREDHKLFYNLNNSRNNCIFNKTRIMGRLISMDAEEYDNHMVKELLGKDTEFIPKEELEEGLEEKYSEILKEVKDYFKKKSKS